MRSQRGRRLCFRRIGTHLLIQEEISIRRLCHLLLTRLNTWLKRKKGKNALRFPLHLPPPVYAGGIVDDFSSGGRDKGRRTAKKGADNPRDSTMDVKSGPYRSRAFSGHRSHPLQWRGARFATEWTT
ncbi:hypothetical protein HNY73_000532 [Argiope bruennichi]|uniref:Uncharacterized protein n=1 Tax=Argiope bruennichi TaxID=94029 RepID=A0A8T0FYD0_ARGBR|nr:hypothetical protein HNY73_000532 [Argiope bruennichi]